MLKKLLKILLLIGILGLFLYVNNKWLQVSQFTIESSKLPKEFDGLRIVHITDLHDASFGEHQKRLIEKVQKEQPDLIFITGDLIDSNRYDLNNSLDAVKEFVKIADVYYVTGNHEVATNQVSTIHTTLKKIGVNVLTNEAVTLERNGEEIVIAGIDDPLMGIETQSMLDKALVQIPKSTFSLLLAHRPEEFPMYVAKGVDVVFSGHAHGGQIRIPGIGGLIAPGQGWLPEYTAGIYKEEETTMVVSRGLGNSLMPIRLFNLPEIVVVTLQATK